MLGNEEEKQKMADNGEGDKCQNSEKNAVNPDEIIDDRDGKQARCGRKRSGC